MPGSMPPGGGGGDGTPILEAATTVFPDVYPSDYSWEPTAFQSVLDLANGSRQVTEFSPDLQRVFSLRYAMEDDDFLWRQLMPHFNANKAATFSFFDFWQIPWPEGMPFATGDGISRTFYPPAKEVEGLTIFVDGTAHDDLTPESGASLAWTALRARRKFTVWYYGGPNTPPKLKPLPIDGGIWGAELQLIEELA